jgi:hypothetical protein
LWISDGTLYAASDIASLAHAATGAVVAGEPVVLPEGGQHLRLAVFADPAGQALKAAGVRGPGALVDPLGLIGEQTDAADKPATGGALVRGLH